MSVKDLLVDLIRVYRINPMKIDPVGMILTTNHLFGMGRHPIQIHIVMELMNEEYT